MFDSRSDHRFENLGVVAQLGERVICTHEVRGSVPLDSTKSIGVPTGASMASFAGKTGVCVAMGWFGSLVVDDRP